MLPALAATTSAQLGVFTRQQALAAGYDADEIRHALRTNEWVRVRRGVYTTGERLRSVSSDPAARHRLLVAAALLVVDGEAVASQESACAVHGLDTLEPIPDRVLLSRASGESHAGRTLHVTLSPLDPDEITEAAGLPTTSAARTVLDLARRLPFRNSVVTADHALRLGLTTPDELRELLLRRPSWPRGGRALQVIRFADGRSESVGESVSRVLFAAENLPAPTLQLEVFDHEELLGRLDFAWEEQRVAGEFDGALKYTDREVLLREKRREDRLRALGWRFVRFGWPEVHRPRTLARRIRAMLDQRQSA